MHIYSGGERCKGTRILWERRMSGFKKCYFLCFEGSDLPWHFPVQHFELGPWPIVSNPFPYWAISYTKNQRRRLIYKPSQLYRRPYCNEGAVMIEELLLILFRFVRHQYVNIPTTRCLQSNKSLKKK
jgi:hypothetical protein